MPGTVNSRPPPRVLTLIRKQQITQHVLRVTVGGDSLKGFPEHCESANIKLLLAHREQTEEEYLASIRGTGLKPLKRTYTVLAFRPDELELDIDFALHPTPGPATRWASHAKPGDRIGVAGPGTQKRINLDADWFLFCADISSLPALSVNLTLLPAKAIGQVFIAVEDAMDIRALEKPEHVHINWLVQDASIPGNTLLNQVKSCAFPGSQMAAWVAGEANMVRSIKEVLVSKHALEPAFRYTSGYWMEGQTEDSFQPFKRSTFRD